MSSFGGQWLKAGVIGGASLLTISAAQAEAMTPSEIIDIFDMPDKDDPASYYNRATTMAISEECEQTAADTVTCWLTFISNNASLMANQTTVYKMDGNGSLILYSSAGPGEEVNKEIRKDYDKYKENAERRTLTRDSRLAVLTQTADPVIIQNNVGVISGSYDQPSICSVAPVSDKRAFKVCYSFDMQADVPKVQTSLTPVVVGPNWRVIEAPVIEVERDYQLTIDESYLTKLRNELGGSGYVFRPE